MVGKSFLFSLMAAVMASSIFVFGAASAHAYAVSSTGQPLGGQASQPAQPSTSTGVNTNYNFNNSFQNLVSPFQSFFNSLHQWNTNAMTQINPTSTNLPPVNVLPGLQNTITQPFADFDNWFYNLTGVRLSGIVFVILNIISWALGLILGVVNWLLGLFH